LEVLLKIAEAPRPQSLRTLNDKLDLPRASLHRLLRALTTGGFLVENGGAFSLGTQSRRLHRAIGRSMPHSADEFPQCARPIIERLASDTGETVILGSLSEERKEIVYSDVIVAESPLQYAVPAGDRRPLYSSATGKAVLAFLPRDEQRRYLDETAFEQFTPYTTRKDQIGALLERLRSNGVIHDRDGHFVGAGAIASPIFDARGAVFASVVVAGPNERVDSHPHDIPTLVRDAGEAISRLLGYNGLYPPQESL